MEEDPSYPDAKPPRYESIQQRLNPQQPYIHFPDGITQNMPPPMMVANGAWLPYNNTFQHSPQAANPMFMSNEWIEERKRSTETMLEKRGVPPNIWKYYLEAPEDWDTGEQVFTEVSKQS